VRRVVNPTATAALLALLAGASSPSPSSASPPARTEVYETRHYRLHSDVDPDLARDLAKRLDAMYDEYARRLAALGPGSMRRHDVHVFARKADYGRFIDDRLPNTGGVYIPGRNVLAAFVEDQGRDALRRTLQHEAFHQFADATLGPDAPVWLNEGIAQLFEEGIWTGQRFIVEQVPQRRLRQLSADLDRGRLVPFDEFLATDHKAWARNMRDRERGSSQYNQAWAMVHFLVYAAGPDGQPLYRKRFFDMLRRIKAGQDPRSAFETSFSDNYAGFQRRFDEYFRLARATREASYVEHLEVLADMTVLLAEQEGRRFRSVAELRRHLERGGYQLHYTKGSLRWSSDPAVEVYFRDLEGRELPATQFAFVPVDGRPLPDLVLRPPGGLEYRARFHRNAKAKLEREVIVRGL